jgi:hypothetical protein
MEHVWKVVMAALAIIAALLLDSYIGVSSFLAAPKAA